MKPLSCLSLTLACVVLALPADAAAADRVHAVLHSHEEVPAISSGAVGAFRAEVDAKAGRIIYELNFVGLEGEVRQAHIHLGQRGVNGGVSVFLCQTSAHPDPTGLAPTCPASGRVSGVLRSANVVGPAGQGLAAGEFDELVRAIFGGVAYVNVHTSVFGGGEIRGQLQRSPQKKLNGD